MNTSKQEQYNCFLKLFKHFNVRIDLLPFIRWYFLLKNNYTSLFEIDSIHYYVYMNNLCEEDGLPVMTYFDSEFEVELYFEKYNFSCGIKDEDGQSVYYVLYENGRWCLYNKEMEEYSQTFTWKEKSII